MFDVSNRKGFNDVYGFIDPSMTHERNKFDDIQTYITTYFEMGKVIYFLPYIHGCHWQYDNKVSYECGYYVMFWMMTIIRAHYTSGWETVIFRFEFYFLYSLDFIYTN
ncbi:hypothetical protein LR48_Vigan511s009000 [Vigna angularis]|uniref:Ubiquitin-like protease family profile domain-containing protein n=1 Tax=Phaseolus angularis TaxID=3914 RepID=A0A0L9TCM0_PHAAN|nr:hypothetical protein LR48_Vigan511s009000 [Vigna angularis]